MTTSNAGKYRAIVAAITLFVFFIVSVLAINFYLSTKIGADATKVNLAGRQRTLSQQMTKSLLLMDIALAKGQDIDKPLAELKSAHAFFDKTLTGFTNGGMVTAPDGNLIILEQVITERGMMLLFDTRKEWDPVNRALRKITAFNGYPYDDTAAQKLGDVGSNEIYYSPRGRVLVRDLQEAIAVMSTSSTKLHNLMNSLTVHLDQAARACLAKGVVAAGLRRGRRMRPSRPRQGA